MYIGNTPQTGAEKLMQKVRISVLESRRERLGPEWHFDLCSPFWRLYVNDRPGAWLVHKGRKVALEGGRVWLVPAWVRFQTGLSRPVWQDYLHFEVRGFPGGFLQHWFGGPVSLRTNEALRALCGQWRASAGLPHLSWAAALAHAAFASALTERPADGGEFVFQEHDEGLREVMDAMETRLADPPSNRELARLFGCSEDHFIRRFRRATGMTPSDYGRSRRIAAAAEWLAGTDRTLEDVAAASGFTDRFHFSRVFKKRFGQSPAAYRRMHRKELAALVNDLGDQPESAPQIP